MTTYYPGSSLPDDARKKWIQREANKLLLETFEYIHTVVPGVFCIDRNMEDQTDKGVDFEIEVEAHGETIQSFKLQNKGQERRLEPLKTTERRGCISFQITIKHIRYYRHQVNFPLIFTVCDLEEKKVYWHPIQLDDDLDKRIEMATSQDSIQLYLDPKKTLSIDTIHEFFKDVELSNRAQSKRFRRLAKHPLVKLTDGFEIDRSKHILDQMTGYLDWTHKHLSYFPLTLLINSYPFKKRESYSAYYNLFRLYTDNDQIVAMLKAVKVENHRILKVEDKSFFTGVDNYEEKLYRVFTLLSNNLVWEISNQHGDHENHFHLYDSSDDNNLITSYERLDFVNAMKGLGVAPVSMKERWCQAFTHCRFGNYLKSVEGFKEIAGLTKANNDTIGHFIANFNLKRLAVIIQHSYWDENAQPTLVEELKAINLDDIYYTYRKEDGPDILSYLNNNNFNDRPKQQTERLLKHLQQTYYLSHRGGWSSNNYTRELVNEFADYLSFISKNFIIQESYFPFHQILDDFIEGLFGSYGQHKKLPGRLRAFDSYHLFVLSLYADSEALVKYAIRYGINELDYARPHEDTNESFFRSISTFFVQGPEIRQVHEQICEQGNHKFWDHYNQIYGSILTLLAYLKIETELLNTIVAQILAFLRNDNILIPHYSEKTYLLLRKKGDQLSESNLLAFHQLVMKQGRFHSGRLRDAVLSCLIDRKIKLNLDEKGFLRLRKFLLDKCENCGNQHTLTNLHDYYFILGEQHQQEWIQETIFAQLEAKFNPELYYISSINDVIPYNAAFFDIFLARSIPQPDRITFKQVFRPHDYRHFNHLDELFNLAFKFQLPLTSTQFDPFRNLNLYYDWLLNMEGFDYDKFDVEWLLEYPTSIFLDQFRKYARIKDVLEDTLTRQSHARLENLYFKLYNSNSAKPI